jgi:hypothetical protein
MGNHNNSQIEKNHNRSQLEDLRKDPKELYDRRVGRVGRSCTEGKETPLGHAFSIIIEELAEQGIECEINPNEFLDSIKKYLKSRGLRHITDDRFVNMASPCLYREHTNPIVLYMKEKGLSLSSCKKIMYEILGPKAHELYTYKTLENIGSSEYLF